MNTKVINIAMFAIAAFALTGMIGGSAFASHTTTNQDVNNTDDDTTQTSSPTWNSITCPGTSATCEQKTKVYNDNPSDKTKVYFNVSSGSCDIKVEWFNEGSPQGTPYTKTGQSGTSSVSHFFNITDTDDITTIVTYTNCS